MPWSRAPALDYCAGQSRGSIPPTISKDFLRNICEPFFDQMLVAVQQALQAQVQCQSRPCEQPLVCPTRRPWTETSTEAGSNASESGAFSSLLTPTPSIVNEAVSTAPVSTASVIKDTFSKAGHTVSGHQNVMPMVNRVDAEDPRPECKEVGSEDPSDQENCPLVCRHWKSKGFCRMGDNCKFLHPANRCGVVVVPGDKIGGMNSNFADVSFNASHGSDSLVQLAGTASEEAKKSRRKRKNKGKTGKANEEADVHQNAFVTQLSIISA